MHFWLYALTPRKIRYSLWFHARPTVHSLIFRRNIDERKLILTIRWWPVTRRISRACAMWHSNLFLTPPVCSTSLPQREAIFIRNGLTKGLGRSTALNSRSSQQRASVYFGLPGGILRARSRTALTVVDESRGVTRLQERETFGRDERSWELERCKFGLVLALRVDVYFRGNVTGLRQAFPFQRISQRTTLLEESATQSRLITVTPFLRVTFPFRTILNDRRDYSVNRCQDLNVSAT